MLLKTFPILLNTLPIDNTGRSAEAGSRASLGRAAVALLFWIAVLAAPCAAQSNYSVSWLANNFTGGASPHVQDNIDTIFVAPNGTIYSNGSYDEDHASAPVFSGGTIVGAMSDLTTTGRAAGGGVVSDGTYVYVGMSQNCDCSSGSGGNGFPAYGTTLNAVRRYSATYTEATGGNAGIEPYINNPSAFAASKGSYGPDGSMLVVNTSVTSNPSAKPVVYSQLGSIPLGIALIGSGSSEMLYAVNYSITNPPPATTPTITNQILGWNVNSLTSAASVVATLPSHLICTQMVAGPSGNPNTLWLAMQSDGTSGVNSDVYEVNVSTGAVTAMNVSGLVQPTALAFSTSGTTAGELMVADNGLHVQQILFVNVATLGGAVVESTFGQAGGVLNSSTPGVFGPTVFLGLVGVGMDSSGNLTIAEHGSGKQDVMPPGPNATLPYTGAPNYTSPLNTFLSGPGVIINTYAPSGSSWTLSNQFQNHSFVNSGSIDPSSESDIYSWQDHFTFNYAAAESNPSAPEWTYAGITLDYVHYPQDPRIGQPYSSAFLRRINGQPFLFAIGQTQAGEIMIYRFNGAIAVPSGQIHFQGQDTELTNQPGYGGASEPSCENGVNPYVWIDSNGNGSFDTDEYTVPSVACFNNPTHTYAWQVDSAGNIWVAVTQTSEKVPTASSSNAIFEFPFQGLDSYGNPKYPSWDDVVGYPIPTTSGWTDPTPLQGGYLACSGGIGFQCNYPPLTTPVASPSDITVTSASETGNGTTGTFTFNTSATVNFTANEAVSIDNFPSGSAFNNITGVIASVGSNSFTVANVPTKLTTATATGSGSCTGGTCATVYPEYLKTQETGYAYCPTDLCMVTRVHYDPTTDSMYMAGVTAADHNIGYASLYAYDWQSLVKYNNWSNPTTRSVAWAVSLPYALYDELPGNGGKDWGIPATMDVAGDLVFVGYNYDTIDNNPNDESGAVLVLNALTGATVETMERPTAMDPYSARIDTNYGINAYQRAAGDYIVLEEEDAEGKIVEFDLNYGQSNVVLNAPADAASGYTLPVTTTVSNLSGTTVYSTPTGTVTVVDTSNGNATVCTGTLSSGTVTCNNSSLSVGTHVLQSQYSGDSTHMPFLSNLFTVTVVSTPASTTTTINSASPASNTAGVGASITFTATVTATLYGTPTGTVTFYNGSTSLGSATLNGSGVATFPTTALPAGTDSITAKYNGDSSDSTSTSAPFIYILRTVTSLTGLSGTVNGGPNAVSGATVQIYQIGQSTTTGGYIANASSLLSSPITTASNGTFSVTGSINCLSGTYLYLTATGGNPGAGTNTNLALMTSLGLCDNLSSSTTVTVNEVTTVAAAYAFAQFSRDSLYGTLFSSAPGNTGGTATPAYNLATSASNLAGLAAAANWAAVLANPTTGSAPGTNGNGALNSPLTESTTGGASTGAVAEFWQINTIANILAACVNTAANCTTLFADVPVPSGTNPATSASYAAPVDTIQATAYMALDPGQFSSTKISALYAIIAAIPPFTPQITTAADINDFSVAVYLSPVVPGCSSSCSVMNQPTQVSIDGQGNAWVVNQITNANSPNDYNTFFVELTPTGVPVQAGSTSGDTVASYRITSYTVGSTSTNIGGEYIENTTTDTWGIEGRAIPVLDTNGNMWVQDRQKANEIKVSGSGGSVFAPGRTGTYHNGGNAGDSGGNGAVGYALPSGSAPVATLVDGSNNVWVWLNGYYNPTTGVNSTGTSGACSTGNTLASITYNNGLIGLMGESTSNVVYGGATGVAGLYPDPQIDPNLSVDAISGATIPGAPFLWFANSGGVLYQNYSTAPATGDQGCASAIGTIGAVGSYTGSYSIAEHTNVPVPGDAISAMDNYEDFAFDYMGNIWQANFNNMDTENDTTFIVLSATETGNGTTGTFTYTTGNSTGSPTETCNNLVAGSYARVTNTNSTFNVDGIVLATGLSCTTFTITAATTVTSATFTNPNSPATGAGGEISYEGASPGLRKITPNYGTTTFGPTKAAFTFTAFYGNGATQFDGFSPSFGHPNQLTADGLGNIWLNGTGGQSEVSNAGTVLTPNEASTITQFSGDYGLLGSYCSSCRYNGENAENYYRYVTNNNKAAIDLAGNIWLTDGGTGLVNMEVIIGVAAPLPPVSVGLANGTAYQRP